MTKINNKILEAIKGEAQKFFVNASGCHDWSHVERVYDLAMHIAKTERGVNLGALKAAVYLHDIGRREEMASKGKICHAEKGVELAQKILKKYNLEPKIVADICHAILAHRYRNNHQPKTIEAKVLYDADKLDGIGAIGIARDFLFAGHSGSNCLYTGNEKKLAARAQNYAYTKEDSALLEYYFSIINIKDKILTKTGKKIANERHRYMTKFFQRFEQEIKGIL